MWVFVLQQLVTNPIVVRMVKCPVIPDVTWLPLLRINTRYARLVRQQC